MSDCKQKGDIKSISVLMPDGTMKQIEPKPEVKLVKAGSTYPTSQLVVFKNTPEEDAFLDYLSEQMHLQRIKFAKHMINLIHGKEPRQFKNSITKQILCRHK